MTDKEIHNHCRKYLPHIENQRYQMITYRLYDSVPREVIEQWKREVGGRVRASSPPNNEDAANGTQASSLQNLRAGSPRSNASSEIDVQWAGSPHSNKSKVREKLVMIDKYEDSGVGQCFMRDDRVAQIVKDTLFYYDGKKYKIIAWCIMPNHVHILIEVFNGFSLSEIIHSWKSFSANQINKLLNRAGQVWMMEYFDRYIRDYEHFDKVVNYIHNNPVKAGLVKSPSEYRWSSAYEEGSG
jgi:REP element-mobilizing transposase RayT